LIAKVAWTHLCPKNIINEIHRTTTTGPATSLFIGNFYLDEEIAQAELRQALAEDSFTWLSLKALAARSITLTPQKHSGDFWNYYWCPLYNNIHIIPKFGHHLKQKYFYLRKNKKLLYLLNLKIKRNLIKIKLFRFIYTDSISFQKITEGIRLHP
jgi:hypothetical protein